MSIPKRREFLAYGSAALAVTRSAHVSLFAASSTPLTDRTILASAFPAHRLETVLLPRERWNPYPTAADRRPWEQLPAEARLRLIAAAERHLGHAWPTLPATLFLGFVREGNRSRYEHERTLRRNRLRELAIGECLEGKGRFLDEIANGIWLTCEETYWGLPAHLNAQKAGTGLPDVTEPTVDLFAAETASQLAWTSYLLAPQLTRVSPLIPERIRVEVDRRVLTPNLERVDFGWMGLDPKYPGRPVNNWNPWINSNWLASNLLLERDPVRRRAAVAKILVSLDRFLSFYHDDGGCDEGPSYWSRAGGSLFDCLELLHSASDGRMQFYDVPLIQEIGRYLYRAHIHNDYYINFADASARVNIAGDLVFRYGQRIGDENLAGLGAFAAKRQDPGTSDSIGRQLPALFDLEKLEKSPGRQPLVRDVWLPGIQVMAARLKDRSAEGLYLAAQGGHNAESHNHNDVGNFLVYVNGEPVIVDVGVETYSAKTFSSHRYEIWTMQSAYHNLPTVGGVMQAAGREFEASDVEYQSNDDAAEFSLDIARAYPREAGIRHWKRTLRLDRRKNEVGIRDDYSLEKPVGQIAMTLMTPCQVKPASAGELAFIGSAVSARVLYDGQSLKPRIEPVEIKDGRLRASWGEKLYRVQLIAERPPKDGIWSTRILQA